MDFSERLARFGSASFTELRPAQTSVLAKLGDELETHTDIGVELPTGAGKTLVALLAADWALDQGLSVAYLAGTTQLADQVVEQASVLGIDAFRFSSKNYPSAQKRDYDDAQQIGVMSYWTYFNGNPQIAPADFLILDDAHLAEQALSGMFTCRVARDGTIAKKLFESIIEAILVQAHDGYPALAAIRDGTAPASTPPELISFVDWSAVEPTVRELIMRSRWLEDNRWPWRSVESQLGRCGVLIGPHAIEIRPYHLPTQTSPYYSRSKYRLYLSATLGQTGDIQRRLGTKPVHIVAAAVEAESLGRREFILNPTGDAALSDSVLNFALEQVELAGRGGAGRVAWLCTSHAEADVVQEKLRTLGYPVNRLSGSGDQELERWRMTPAAHLVTAGRFDGLDFADDICRLVILPSVPVGSTEFERFVVAYLGDASYMRYRVGQRVTQALGRANRTPTDSALYLGLDPNFSGALADATVQNALGAHAKAIVNRSLELHDAGWDATRTAANDFWSNKGAMPELERRARERPGRRALGHAAVNSADDEVLAATSLWLGDGPRAAEFSEKAAAALYAAGELEHSAFWKYVAAQAWAVDGNLKEARSALSSAVEAAPQTAWFVRLRRTMDSLDGHTTGLPANDSLFLVWDEWVREYPRALADVAAAAASLLDNRPIGIAASLRTLARLCGVDSDGFEASSSVLQRWTWATSDRGQRRLWSIHASADLVTREDVYDLRSRVADEQARFPLSKVEGCLILLSGEVPENLLASLNGEVLLVHRTALRLLTQTLGERFTAYSGKTGTGTATERGEARQVVEPRLPDGPWLALLLDSNRIVLADRGVTSAFA